MIPEHYARDIAVRCSTLISSLTPILQNDLAIDSRFGGPLVTTFLIAMGAPMIILPVERLFKPPYRGVADDREIDPELAETVRRVLGKGQRFGNAPFVREGTWSYVGGHVPFNIAAPWPYELLRSLSDPQATKAASAAPASRVVTDLRNALAHGGIAYLDEQGQQTAGQASMLAFAGAVMDRGQLTAINVLRIHEQEYRRFLSAWADWLGNSQVTEALNQRVA